MPGFTHYATLKRGMTFTLLEPNPENPKQPTEHSFKKNEAKPVTAAVKKLLEKAVDRVTISGGRSDGPEDEERQKFAFTPYGEAEENTAPVRKRTARTAG